MKTAILSLLFGLAILLSGCTHQMKLRKAGRKLNRIVTAYPELSRTDTVQVIDRDTIAAIDGRAVIPLDTTRPGLDTLLSGLYQSLDSTKADSITGQIRRIVQYHPPIRDTVYRWIDSIQVKVYPGPSPGQIGISLNRPQKIVTEKQIQRTTTITPANLPPPRTGRWAETVALVMSIIAIYLLIQLNNRRKQ